MPIVDVTYGSTVPEGTLRRLSLTLPHAVSLAVECPEEPYDHSLEPGDVELRFHPRGPFDPPGLDLVVEVRSKWFPSRDASRQERSDGLRASIESEVGRRTVGVYLTLPVAGWSQTE